MCLRNVRGRVVSLGAVWFIDGVTESGVDGCSVSQIVRPLRLDDLLRRSLVFLVLRRSWVFLILRRSWVFHVIVVFVDVITVFFERSLVFPVIVVSIGCFLIVNRGLGYVDVLVVCFVVLGTVVVCFVAIVVTLGLKLINRLFSRERSLGRI